MLKFPSAVPASLREPAEAKHGQSMNGRISSKTVLIAGRLARAAALSKSRFARLPEEPEDARLTGVTRSLNRRLLALNLRGSLRRSEPMPEALIA